VVISKPVDEGVTRGGVTDSDPEILHLS